MCIYIYIYIHIYIYIYIHIHIYIYIHISTTSSVCCSSRSRGPLESQVRKSYSGKCPQLAASRAPGTVGTCRIELLNLTNLLDSTHLQIPVPKKTAVARTSVRP